MSEIELKIKNILESIKSDPKVKAAGYYADFVVLISERMKELGLSQEALGKRLGNKSRSAVNQVLQRKMNPSLAVIIEYLNAVGLDLKPTFEDLICEKAVYRPSSFCGSGVFEVYENDVTIDPTTREFNTIVNDMTPYDVITKIEDDNYIPSNRTSHSISVDPQ